MYHFTADNFKDAISVLWKNNLFNAFLLSLLAFVTTFHKLCSHSSADINNDSDAQTRKQSKSYFNFSLFKPKENSTFSRY